MGTEHILKENRSIYVPTKHIVIIVKSLLELVELILICQLKT